MFFRLKANLVALRSLISRFRQKGYGLPTTLLIHVPMVLLERLYRKIACAVNARLLNRSLNYPRFRRFVRTDVSRQHNHFYIIVMPDTLHFLLPCLQLLPPQIAVTLLINGARGWECNFLQKRHPRLKQFRLLTLPGSSLAHGDVISLLLACNTSNFGIIDHDLYLFDSSVFARLEFAENECMLALFKRHSQRTGLTYPETHFLFFNSSLLRKLMTRYQVDAGLYRKVPQRLLPQLQQIGLDAGRYFKAYHNFLDTLHLLLALACSENLQVRYIDARHDVDIFHLGGTSIGSYSTKDFYALYMSMCFLEMLDEPNLNKHYAHLHRPFHHSYEIRQQLAPTARNQHMLKTIDMLITRLTAMHS